jgi:hypothetical protein
MILCTDEVIEQEQKKFIGSFMSLLVCRLTVATRLQAAILSARLT